MSIRLSAAAAVLLVPSLALAAPKFSASSEKEGRDGKHSADLAFDGLLHTSWAEDKGGAGAGEWLEVDLGADTKIGTLTLWAGAFGGYEEWQARGRGAEVTISGSGPDGDFRIGTTLGDRYARKDITLDKTVRTLRLTIDEVHEGAVFGDLHIAEIAFDLKDKPDPSWQAVIDKNLGRSRSTRDLATQWPDQLRAAYDACKTKTAYSDNFKTIGWAAAHGPEYLIEQVDKFVPVGHRLKMLQFNETAVDMLGRLKDPNAIRYLEIASAGAVSRKDADWLMDSVKDFQAYGDLIRNPRATVPNWGSTGLERGAFQSRGEPLALAADSAGNIWVADVGNNRVQRLTAAGTPDVILGNPDKGVVRAWFGEDDDPYASAAKAGTGPTEFTQPMDLTVGNYDVLAVVDATLAVRTFDAEGKPKAQWKVESAWKPSAGAGIGTPVITWKGDDFYVIVRDTVYVYGADGAELKRYTLEGGPVQCGVIAAGGRLLVRHVGESEIIEYKPEDGFRQGKWIKKDLPDDGSEDWDLATDDDDSVYIVTDAGSVFKYNKRGKFVKRYQVYENSKDVPRVAAWSNVIYVSAKDTITRVEQEE